MGIGPIYNPQYYIKIKYCKKLKFQKMKNNFLAFEIFLIIFSLSYSQDIIFSKDSGFYPKEFLLTLSLSSPNEKTKIYFTEDGSDPTNSNTTKEYTEPILIKKNRSNEPNIYSAIEENEDSPISVSHGIGFKKPPFLVDKCMVIRVVTKNNNGYGKITEKIYFITTGELVNYEKYTVVSLVTNPDNLFDPEKGIYVTGNQFISWKNSENYNPNKSIWDLDNPCNYFMKGSEWEREANFVIFEKGVVTVEQNVGIRIKGSTSRNSPPKGFNIYARKKYGKGKIKSNTLLPNNLDKDGNLITEYDSISLRSVHLLDRLRNQLSLNLIHDRKFQATTDFKSCVLFLNGEYWGMYALMEKFSSDFFSKHYVIPKNNVVYFKQYEIEEGPKEEYNNIMNFMSLYSKKDLSNTVLYQEICDKIDIDSFIEHYAANIYIGTYDWPNHNFGMWKYNGSKIDENKYSDGKWRFMSYDLDHTLGETYEDFGGVEGYEYDNFQHMDKRKTYPPTNLFVALFKNKEFKTKFEKIYEYYVNELMISDKLNLLLEEYKENITDLICSSQTRWWGYFSGTKLQVYAYIKNKFHSTFLPDLQKFFEERPKNTLDHMKNYLSLT